MEDIPGISLALVMARHMPYSIVAEEGCRRFEIFNSVLRIAFRNAGYSPDG